MKFKVIIFLVGAMLFLTSCGSEKSSENLDFIAKEKVEEFANQSSENLPVTFGNDRIYYVSKGRIDYEGITTFRSITDALKKMKDDMVFVTLSSVPRPFSYKDVTLIIKEGTYGTDTNETYPIDFPADLKIVGEGSVTINNESFLNWDNLHDEIMMALISIAYSEFDPIIKLNHNTIMDNITINAGYGVGIIVTEDSSAILKNSTISKSKTGVRVKDNAKIMILNSSIEENTLGIEISDASKAIIKGTKVFKNEIGIKSSDVSKLQFSDKNLISDNLYCGLYDRGRGSDLVLSDQIEWNVPKIYDQCQHGVSIASNRDRTIIFQRVQDYIQLFSDIPVVDLTYPTHRSTVTTTTPNITWIPTANNVVTKVVIFNSLPIVSSSNIINKEDIVWYWNSDSADRRKLGDLKFSDGKSHSKLIKGKGYYSVVFEMNKEQTEMTAVSPVNFFTVSGDY